MSLLSPREQSRLFGYQAEEAMLARGFREGTLHHSLLLTGPVGIGKATLAYRFARFILSGGAALAEPESHPFSLFGPEEKSDVTTEGDGALYMPDTHGIFKRVANGTHADLLVIEPEFDAKKGVYKDEIQAEVAREIGGFLALTPAESEWRVVIIDAADQLNEKAANALLKSIEEPPARAFIILVCHNPQSVLPTIRSRCRNIAMQTPDLEGFGAVLRWLAPDIAFGEYDALHQLSHGSPGFAVQLATYEALTLYQTLLTRLAEASSPAEIQALATTLASDKAPLGWRMAKHLFLTLTERAACAPTRPLFAGEDEKLAHLRTKLGLKRLFALRERMQSLFRDTDALYLDRTQVLAQLMKAA
jgi:DNA polymerase-3 subunit delta'